MTGKIFFEFEKKNLLIASKAPQCKDNQGIRNRGDTKYSQTENSQNQAAQEDAWVQVSTAGGGAGGWSS